MSPADDSDAPAAPRALVAAQARIKALLDTVRQLEEERGAALLRVAALEARPPAPVDGDLDVARALVDVMPRHPRRAMSTRSLAVCLALTEGPRTVGSLREALGLSQSTASEWIAGAVAKGLVELLGSEIDRRQHPVQLTPKGWVAMRDRAPRGRAVGAPRGRVPR